MNEETQDKMIVHDDEPVNLDPNFKYEIAKQTGGEKILKCLQCGTCSGICPVFEIDERYDPQKIIKMALNGMKNELLSSELIWMCSTCYSCYEYCPQDVKVTELMCAIQNIATRYGHTAPVLEDKIAILKQHARTIPMNGFDNKKRSKFKLPPIQERPDDIAQIIEHTGIEKILDHAMHSMTNEDTIISQEGKM
ncbi:MAG: 4Fe-4S dicluster domain-containing protein [Thermoplasmata archaeon]|nr:MAG: 4Fe-4S dicluster domain-containing protein [Thermoplasmata archaeon]